MSLPTIDPSDFSAIIAERDARISGYRVELHARDVIIEKLKFQLDGIRRLRLGAKSETLDQLYLWLKEKKIIAGTERQSPAPPNDDRENAKPKRRQLPGHLPRDEEINAPLAACSGCGSALRPLGDK